MIYFKSLGPPLNLTATLLGNGLVQLSWIPSNGEQDVSVFNYVVQIKNGNGTLDQNITVRSSQLIISSTDPCHLSEAILIPLCQSIAPMTSALRLQIPGGSYIFDLTITKTYIIKRGCGGREEKQ